MKDFILTLENLKSLKSQVREQYAISSAHLSECLASALGFKSHSALLAKVKSPEYAPMSLVIDEAKFISRLTELGIQLSGWRGISCVINSSESGANLIDRTNSPVGNKTDADKNSIDSSSPIGCAKFCTLMGWPVIRGSLKSADRTYPAGFNLFSASGLKIRAFVYGIPFDGDEDSFFKCLTADFCKQDGFDNAIMFFNSRPTIINDDGSEFTFTGMLYTTKVDEWTPMFVNRSMASIESLFSTNSTALRLMGGPPDKQEAIADNDGYAAHAFDMNVRQ